MDYSWNEYKAGINLEKHGVQFEDILSFDWDSAWVIEDGRKNYGEPRYQAIGFIGNRLHVLVFTVRSDLVRVISLRKANRREVRNYGQA